MAVINQSPAGQANIGLSGISYNSIGFTASPTWKSTKIIQNPSVQVNFSSSAAPLSVPTVGQIYPRGYS